jgi:hypothetical protein
MPRRSAEVTAYASPADVFAEIPATWTTELEQVTSGPIGVGTRFAQRSDRVRYWDITEYDPPQVYMMEHRLGKAPPVVLRYEITPNAAGTGVRLDASMTYSIFAIIFKMGLFAAVLLPVLSAYLRKLDLNAMLDDLKSRAELAAG